MDCSINIPVRFLQYCLRSRRNLLISDRNTINAGASSPNEAATSAAALSTAQLLCSTGRIPVDLMLGMMPMYQSMEGFYSGARMPVVSPNVLPGQYLYL